MAYKLNVSARRTSEFKHYDGCGHKDPENCSACALTDLRQDRPNYAAWPLSYIENHRPIPAKWRGALADELDSDNRAYANNLLAQIDKHGLAFSDGDDSFFCGSLLIERKQSEST